MPEVQQSNAALTPDDPEYTQLLAGHGLTLAAVFVETSRKLPGLGTHAGRPLVCTVTENALLCATRYTCGQAIVSFEKITWS